MTKFGLPGVLAALMMVVSACGTAQSPPTKVFLANAPDVSAMAVGYDGSFYFADVSSGNVFKRTGVDAKAATLVAHVDVSNTGQRGLLGLAVDRSGRLFAGLTQAQGEQNVAVMQLLPGPQRTVWLGPPSAALANGGHIAVSPDNRLTIGIGDLTDRAKLEDPAASNGKLLSLDPDGSSDQKPLVISSHWNNPYAFAYAPNGELWVGDNEPGDGSERLALAQLNGPGITARIGAHKVATGIAFDSRQRLYECTYLSRTLRAFHFDTRGKPQPADPIIASDCSLGVVALDGTTLVYSTGQELRTVTVA